MNSKFLDRFTAIMMPIADKLNKNRYLGAIRDGFFASMPVVIVGSLFLVFPNFPYKPLVGLLTDMFGESWIEFCNQAFDMSVNVMTIFVIYGMAQSLAVSYKQKNTSFVVPSLTAFFIISPISQAMSPGESELSRFLAFESLGSTSLFLGIITTILACEIVNFTLKRGWKIKFPDTVPANVSGSFEALIPSIFVIVIFALIYILFKNTSFESAQQFIFTIIQEPLTAVGKSIWAMIFVEILATLLFAFGLHGPDIVGSVVTPIWSILTLQNLEAFRAGEPLPNIATGQFDKLFVTLGGCGATIGFVLLMLFFSKSKQYKSLGKLSIGATLFNINEPVIFGTPIVLNPLLMIPFILSPLLFASATYLVMKLGLVPPPNGIRVPWTTPLIISGFFVSGWRGALWQFIEILLSMAWYFPFFKIVDCEACRLENIKELEIEEKKRAVIEINADAPTASFVSENSQKV